MTFNMCRGERVIQEKKPMCLLLPLSLSYIANSNKLDTIQRDNKHNSYFKRAQKVGSIGS